jgi:endonuclease/exonuclease/phosphatase family metal-dependent hydrolase
MFKLAGTLLKTINVVVVALYLLACLIPVLPAGKFWMVAVIGLAFPILFVIICLFLLGWLITRSKWWMLSLAALLLSWQQITAFAGLNRSEEFTVQKNSETLRVLTWNLSSWGETSKNNRSKEDLHISMASLVENQQADVLCFQEFWDKKNLRSTGSVIREFKEKGYAYSYFATTFINPYYHRSGVVIFSKYPIVDSFKYSYGKNDYAEDLIYADILVRGQKIRMFTTHLQSVRFDHDEYTAINKIKHTDETGLKDSRTIVRKLKNAYLFRGSQADFVQQKIKESPYPVIICGDFNDVPNSYTYFTIKGNLQDAFLKKGNGLGRTFQYLSPTLRIDYILADPNLGVQQYHRLKAPYSDHYPLVADFSITGLDVSEVATFHH